MGEKSAQEREPGVVGGDEDPKGMTMTMFFEKKRRKESNCQNLRDCCWERRSTLDPSTNSNAIPNCERKLGGQGEVRRSPPLPTRPEEVKGRKPFVHLPTHS